MNIDIPVLANEPVLARQSPTLEALRRFMHHRSAQVGLVLLSLLLIMAIFAPLIAPFDPTAPLDNVTHAFR